MKIAVSKNKIYLICLIVVVFGIMFFYGYKKEYMYEDEVLSYTLANDHHGGRLVFENDTWKDAEELKTYIVVNPDNRFDFKNTISNQFEDPHPPLYEIIMNAVCSLFPGTYSKWYGLLINYISLLFIIILFYHLTCCLFNNNTNKALYVTALYTMSLAMVIQTMYIRMYMFYTIFTTLCMLIHMKELKNIHEGEKYKFYLLLFITTYIGGLVHLSYYIFAFFVSAFYCIYLLFNKQIKKILFYIITYIISFCAILLTYPTMIYNILNNEESVLSEGTASSLTIGEIRTRISTMVDFVNKELFGGFVKVVLLIFFIYLVYLLYNRRITIKKIKNIKPEYILLTETTILYFLTISLITPYLCDRHIFPVFGFILLFAVMIGMNMFDEIFISKKLGHTVLFILGILPLFSQLKAGITDVNTPLRRQLAAENGSTLCIFTDNIYLNENIFDLMEYNKVYFYDYRSELTDNDIIDASELIVYVPETDDENNYFSVIQNYNPKLQNMDKIYVGSYSRVYKLY